MKTIAHYWESFEKTVLSNAAPMQRSEMRKAFYSGAEIMRQMMGDLGDESVSEDAALAMINGWRDEFETFMAEMIAEQIKHEGTQ